jgi:8-oxo-dGTP pyrophosphatase MutT (NUDIX family)
VSDNPLTVYADSLDCVLEPYDWEFSRRRAEHIRAHWRKMTRANSGLYNGRVLLSRRYEHRLDSEGRRIMSVGFFEASFSDFLAWRDFDFPDTDVYNCFAMAVVRSADGAYLLGEMSLRHSSPGAIYFPSGTPDLLDVREGNVDLEGSVLRELAEETGVSAEADSLEPGWTILFDRQYIACLKMIVASEPAAALLSRVREYLAQEEVPELAAAHMVSRRSELDHPMMMRFVRAFLHRLLPE